MCQLHSCTGMVFCFSGKSASGDNPAAARRHTRAGPRLARCADASASGVRCSSQASSRVRPRPSIGATSTVYGVVWAALGTQALIRFFTQLTASLRPLGLRAMMPRLSTGTAYSIGLRRLTGPYWRNFGNAQFAKNSPIRLWTRRSSKPLAGPSAASPLGSIAFRRSFGRP